MGKTVGAFAANRLDVAFNGGRALDATALALRLPNAFVSTALSIGGAQLSKSLMKAMGTNSVLSSIGIGSLATTSVGYAWNASVVDGLVRNGLGEDVARHFLGIQSSSTGGIQPYTFDDFVVNAGNANDNRPFPHKKVA